MRDLLISGVQYLRNGRETAFYRMQNGGTDYVTGMEGLEDNNGGTIARSQLDAAAARMQEGGRKSGRGKHV